MFNLEDQKYIPLLDINAQVYEESEFGCPHIHLGSDSSEKVFMVAFRTVPEDSKGVAHILEHTALCGSQKYPVRDPFFMMIRRSLNTFMNAFTSSDWTAYPFATLNKKDFDNLLSVYLDASFFPNLDYLDFAQEGHRVEFKDADDISSKIEIKGVVYNEMKGAMSSVTSQLWHGMSKHLYPTSTYRFNSGGNPEDILKLTHDELVNFHKSHYHPSNAIFLTAGDVDPKEIQEFIASNVLSKFKPLNKKIAVSNEKRFSSPVEATELYNPQPGDEENHHVVMSWLLGESHNAEELLGTYLMSSVLLDNSASPLRKVLESTPLGKSLSPLTGLDSDQKELVFAAGLEGTKSGDEKKIQDLILGCLEQLVKNGVNKELIESSIHQLEISQREIGGSGMPFGLQLMLSCLSACIHRDDPLSILDLDSSFNKLKDNVNKEGYIETLIKEKLLDNNHRLRFTLSPDTNFNKKNEDRINKELEQKSKNLSIDEKNKIIDLSKKLKERQESEDNPELLPKVGIADIPAQRKYLKPDRSSDLNSNKYIYKTGTNGIVYHSLIYPIQGLEDSEIDFLNMYANILTDIGIGDYTYEDVQKYQSSITGGISASIVLLPSSNEDKNRVGLKIAGKSLEKNSFLMQKLLKDTILNANFFEKKRIKELLEFTASANDKGIIQNGHLLAMNSASSQINKASSTLERMSGVKSISFISALAKDIDNELNLKSFIEKLISIHNKVSQSPSISFTASSLEAHKLNLDLTTPLLESWKNIDLISPQEQEIAWMTGSQVCFCAEAFPTVNWDHEDAAALMILGSVLRNGYLHSAIREKGGAYGAGASQDSNNGVFKFYSYRDPKCKETFSEFQKARLWSIDQITESQLEEGIMGVISSIDKPLSPSGEAASDYAGRLEYRTPESRLALRRSVINCTVDDLSRVSKLYLSGSGSRAVIGGESFRDEFLDQGFVLKDI
ncbi:insulinase family protein [Gammaproteobacteria bacterium]|nr:insulinase family protein [Gammaproteobacteria bacterium]